MSNHLKLLGDPGEGSPFLGECDISFSPERNLFCAVLQRGIADYIAYLLHNYHNVKFQTLPISRIKDVHGWILNEHVDMSAKYCCELTNICYDGFKTYIIKLDSKRYEKEFLLKERRRHEGGR